MDKLSVTNSLPSKLWRYQLSHDGIWWAITSSHYIWHISLQITASQLRVGFLRENCRLVYVYTKPFFDLF
jgi:hypothetical protein